MWQWQRNHVVMNISNTHLDAQYVIFPVVLRYLIFANKLGQELVWHKKKYVITIFVMQHQICYAQVLNGA